MQWLVQSPQSKKVLGSTPPFGWGLSVVLAASSVLLFFCSCVSSLWALWLPPTGMTCLVGEFAVNVNGCLSHYVRQTIMLRVYPASCPIIAAIASAYHTAVQFSSLEGGSQSESFKTVKVLTGLLQTNSVGGP